MSELIGGGIGLLLLGIIGLAIILFLVPLNLWIAAWASGAYVGLPTLVGMRLRRVPPGTVINARISAVKAGLDVPLNDLEAHYLAGGNVVRVVNALISADKANIPLPFQRAAAIDLAGRDVLEAVKMSVIPKVIETPRIAAIAKDGIQLIVVSRLTVRTNIDRLVGGAGEETVIDLTQASTWLGRIFRRSISANVADRAASDIALRVPSVQTWSGSHDWKYRRNDTLPACGSTHRPRSSASSCWRRHLTASTCLAKDRSCC